MRASLPQRVWGGISGRTASLLTRTADQLASLAPRHFPIASKLALVFTLLITAGMLMLGILVARNQGALLEEQMQEFGATVASQMAESSKELLLAEDTLGLESVLNNVATHERILGAAVYNEERQPVVEAGTVPTPDVLSELEGSQAFQWRSEGTPLFSFTTPVVFRDVTVGYALVTFDRSLADRAQEATFRAVAGTTLLLVSFGIIASVILGKRLTRPIYQLMDASQAISEGDFTFRFDERRNDELGSLMDAMNTMSEGLLRKEQVEQTFSRYVSPNVAKEVLSHLESVELGGRHVNASVLFADIVGFTSMSETMDPEEVSGLLNQYFTLIAEAAHAYGGHVDKYIGDCAMLVFGVPREDPDHAFHSVACAVLILSLVAELNARRARQWRPPVHFRIGINTGTMLAGNMGSSDRLEYTVVGDAVNLASRLGHVGGPGQIIVSEEMFEHPGLAGKVIGEQQGEIRIRGKQEPVATYTITDVNRLFRDDLEHHFDEIARKQLETA